MLCSGGRTPDGLGRPFGALERFHAVPAADLLEVPAAVSAEEVALPKLASIAHRGLSVGRPEPGLAC